MDMEEKHLTICTGLRLLKSSIDFEESDYTYRNTQCIRNDDKRMRIFCNNILQVLLKQTCYVLECIASFLIALWMYKRIIQFNRTYMYLHMYETSCT